MRPASVLFLGCLATACLHVPPAIDDTSVATTSTSEPSTASRPSTTTPPPRPSAKATPKPATACPVATGRHTFCDGHKLCSRDANGCEKCVCNTENDADRADFERMDPWDMRQR